MKTRQMVMITPTDEEIEVTLNETKKYFIIKSTSPAPSYYDYCLEPLWKNGRLSIPKTRRCAHGFTDWGDGEYTLYPYRSGDAYWLRQKEEK